MMAPRTLLTDYVVTGSEKAFDELVGRYVNLVYSTALRLVDGDTHRAEDVTQTVFADLAKRAGTLFENVMLGGWLHRRTCYVAADLMRRERRRQQREREAAEMNALNDPTEARFEHIAPFLDEAINQLAAKDRAAVVLRFFEGRDLRSIGAALGSNEDAAQKRVSRALDRLRELLSRRGITASAAGLSIVLSTNAVQAAPAGLAVTISTAAALGGTVVASTATATKALVMTNLQKILIVAALATPAVTGIYECLRISHLRDQVQALQEEQAPLADRSNHLGQQKADAMRRLAAAREENGRLQRDVTELRMLRRQAAQWQGDSADLARMKTAAPEPEAKLRTWVARALQLYQRFGQQPDKAIPELQFATLQDWLNAVERHELGTESDCRQAMSNVRDAGQQKFADMASRHYNDTPKPIMGSSHLTFRD